ncbi:MAG: serine hydrolase domain-containing protein [Oceanicaulis sp.]
MEAFRPGDSGALAAALTEAADGFADRAPAWSLAVVGPDVTWTATRGAPAQARFAAGSIGKSMTAAIVFQLIEEGRLSLQDTVSVWRPDLPNAGAVTLDHLLTHRSGYALQRDMPPGEYAPPEAAFARLKQVGAVFEPGAGWAYSNVGYMLLGDIIAKVEGEPYAAVLQRRILGPLDLSQTHILRPGAPDPMMVAGPYAAAPVSSTAADLVAWWRALLAGEVVGQASLDRMTAQAWPMFGAAKMGYGRGVQIADVEPGPGPLILHSGGVNGFAATLAWSPRHQVFVSVLVNEQSVPAEAALWALIQALDAARG